MRTGHLFAGAGGGILADLILGHQPRFAVEWDDYAAQCLRERIADGWFSGMHLHHGDVRLFDSSDWKGRVDSLHAGFPCTDISVAGRGAGIEGEKSGLWSQVVRVADEIKPSEIFLENSPAIVNRGLVVVLSDLAALGFDAKWLVLPASAVGAPHLRARWWCLAMRADSKGDGRDKRRPESKGKQRRFDAAELCGAVPHTDSTRQQEQRNGQPNEAQQSAIIDGGGDVADSKLPERWPQRGACGRMERKDSVSQREESTGRPQSSGEDVEHADSEHGRAGAGRDDGAKTEHSSWWSAEPGLGRMVNGMAARAHRLRALGNGQVPLQAAAAYLMLSDMWRDVGGNRRRKGYVEMC